MGTVRLILLLFASLVSCASAENFQLLILHNNDVHGRFDETSKTSGTCKRTSKVSYCFGGFGRLIHLVKEARKKAETGKGPPVLFLNAGDTYTGTPWFTVHKAKIAVEFWNLLKPDAMSLGNHEFDYQVKGLLPFAEGFHHPLLTANVDFSEVPELDSKIKKSVVLEVAGRKIGVIGYLTRETKNVALGIDQLTFYEEAESIRKESERLDSEGVKIIIALGHSGFEVDKHIAKSVPLVDVVIGGHTNTFLWNGKQPDIEEPEGPYPFVVTQKSGKKVPVVQAYAYTKYLGHLFTTFDEKGNLVKFAGQPILVNDSIPQDEESMQLLETFKPEVELLMNKVIGNTRVTLDISSCRTKECNFGNLIADAFVSYKAFNYGGNYWTDTPIAIVNGGSIRMSIDKGTLTVGHFLGALPFDINLVSYNLNGTDVRKMLETGVRGQGETSKGEFLQMSGIKVIYDMNRPPWSRVVDVQIRCGQCNVPRYEPLNDKKTYRLISTGYIINGGDSYTVLKENAFNKLQEDLTDLDTIVWYLGKTSLIYPEEGFRIEFLKEVLKVMASGSIRKFTSSTLILTICYVAVYFLR